MLNSDSTMALSPSSADDLSPRPTPKQGGWGENTAVAMEDPRLSIQNQDEIAEIPTIPVLEELAEEDLSFQVSSDKQTQFLLNRYHKFDCMLHVP